MRTLSCVVCSRQSQAFDARSTSPVEMARLSDFTPIVMNDGSFKWLCPTCVTEVVTHVRALQKIFGPHDVYWNSLKYLPEKVG